MNLQNNYEQAKLGIMGIYHTILEDRTAIAIGGEGRVDFLQTLLTQNIEQESPCMMSALLTPQGKLAYDFLIFPRPDIFVLDCDSKIADALIKRLTMYKLRAAVEISRLDETPMLIWSDDGEPLPLPESLPKSLPNFHPSFCEDPRHKALGLRGWFKTPPPTDYPEADAELWTAHRITQGVPQGADEMPSGAVFPLEFGLEQMHGIDFSKGCFIGQEVCSRVHRKGQLRKTLWVADFKDTPPPPQTPITTGEGDNMRTCGEVIFPHNHQALVLIRNDALDKPLQAGQSRLHSLSGLFDFL